MNRKIPIQGCVLTLTLLCLYLTLSVSSECNLPLLEINGTCACGSGYDLTYFDVSESYSQGKPLCTCVQPGEEISPEGLCRCKEGLNTSTTSDGVRVCRDLLCPSNRTLTLPSSILCCDYLSSQEGGVCICPPRVSVLGSKCICPLGHSFNSRNFKCECPPPRQSDHVQGQGDVCGCFHTPFVRYDEVTNSCTCPLTQLPVRGESEDDGLCICSPDSKPLGSNGVCSCLDGFILSPSGLCICPPHSTRVDPGVCECDLGFFGSPCSCAYVVEQEIRLGVYTYQTVPQTAVDMSESLGVCSCKRSLNLIEVFTKGLPQRVTSCVCEPGRYLSTDGVCECNLGMNSLTLDGQCSCSSGLIQVPEYNSTSGLLSGSLTTALTLVCSCPKWSVGLFDCKCLRGMILNGSECVCDQGSQPTLEFIHQETFNPLTQNACECISDEFIHVEVSPGVWKCDCKVSGSSRRLLDLKSESSHTLATSGELCSCDWPFIRVIDPLNPRGLVCECSHSDILIRVSREGGDICVCRDGGLWNGRECLCPPPRSLQGGVCSCLPERPLFNFSLTPQCRCRGDQVEASDSGECSCPPVPEYLVEESGGVCKCENSLTLSYNQTLESWTCTCPQGSQSDGQGSCTCARDGDVYDTNLGSCTCPTGGSGRISCITVMDDLSEVLGGVLCFSTQTVSTIFDKCVGGSNEQYRRKDPDALKLKCKCPAGSTIDVDRSLCVCTDPSKVISGVGGEFSCKVPFTYTCYGLVSGTYVQDGGGCSTLSGDSLCSGGANELQVRGDGVTPTLYDSSVVSNPSVVYLYCRCPESSVWSGTSSSCECSAAGDVIGQVDGQFACVASSGLRLSCVSPSRTQPPPGDSLLCSSPDTAPFTCLGGSNEELKSDGQLRCTCPFNSEKDGSECKCTTQGQKISLDLLTGQFACFCLPPLVAQTGSCLPCSDSTPFYNSVTSLCEAQPKAVGVCYGFDPDQAVFKYVLDGPGCNDIPFTTWKSCLGGSEEIFYTGRGTASVTFPKSGPQTTPVGDILTTYLFCKCPRDSVWDSAESVCKCSASGYKLVVDLSGVTVCSPVQAALSVECYGVFDGGSFSLNSNACNLNLGVYGCIGGANERVIKGDGVSPTLHDANVISGSLTVYLYCECPPGSVLDTTSKFCVCTLSDDIITVDSDGKNICGPRPQARLFCIYTDGDGNPALFDGAQNGGTDGCTQDQWGDFSCTNPMTRGQVYLSSSNVISTQLAYLEITPSIYDIYFYCGS
jgi:hypothetical protein